MSFSPNHPSTQAAHGHRVLVIENDVDTANLVVALLENAGYEVEIAPEGQYGLLLADTFEPELILLDVILPGMSGAEVTQVLRSAPQYAGRFRFTRIMYLADHCHIIQQRFHALPAIPISDYIFKPINAGELLDKVERALAAQESTADAGH